MTTLRDKLNDTKPTTPMFKDIDGNWHCSLTEEDLNIIWRRCKQHDAMYELSDSVDYYIMRG